MPFPYKKQNHVRGNLDIFVINIQSIEMFKKKRKEKVKLRPRNANLISQHDFSGVTFPASISAR